MGKPSRYPACTKKQAQSGFLAGASWQMALAYSWTHLGLGGNIQITQIHVLLP